MLRDHLRALLKRVVAIEPVRTRVRAMGERLIRVTETPEPDPLDFLIRQHRELKKDVSLVVYARNKLGSALEDGDESVRAKHAELTETAETLKGQLINLQMNIEQIRREREHSAMDLEVDAVVRRVEIAQA